MYVTYDVFNELVGTLSRHQTLNTAIKSAKKFSKNGIRLAIFENNGDPSEQKLVKWVFPKKSSVMKTFLLITSIIMTTPEKDFSGVVVEEFKTKTECTIRLDKHQDIMVDFGIMKVEVKRKCEKQ